MATFEESLPDVIRNAFCTYLDTFEGFIGNLAANPFTPFARIPLTTTRWAQRWVCNREPPEYSNPPFTGGQCPNIEYDVTVDFTLTNTSGFTIAGPNTVRVLGPVNGLVIVQPVTPGGENMQLRVLARPITDPSLEFTVVTAASAGAPWEGPFSIQSIVRVDGLPDNCGNPNPDLPGNPEPSPEIPVDVPYDDADGNPITVPIVLIFAPIRVGFNGTLNVPFRIQIDPEFNVQFNGELNLNDNEVNFNFGNPNYAPSPLPVPDDYRSPEDIPDYPPSVPNSISPLPPLPELPETKEVIRAAIVTVSNNTSVATVIGQDANPDIYAPNLGFISFAISIANGIAWTADIPVKNYRHFVPCPWEGGAVQVRGTPRPGVTWTITPVRAKIEEPITF